MDLSKVEKIHFIGVGGIYVSALALLMRSFGKEVSGCDAKYSEMLSKLEKEKIDIYRSHDISHIESLDDGPDLVVYSSAVSLNHLELLKAKELQIKTMTAYELLGEVSKDLFTITVSGTKGKTTTTALIGLILAEANLEPTVIVGGNVKNFLHGNLRVGSSNYLVAEACEFNAQMLSLHPNITILTNIEEDHLDYYRDLDHIIETFKEYVSKLPQDGYLVINGDEINCHKLGCSSGGAIITYGIENPSDVMAKNIKTEAGKQSFELFIDGRKIDDITLQIPGRFNIYNALGAIAAAVQMEVNFKTIKKTLEEFKGVERRFEKVGERKGVIIISDYAHTPTSVKQVIKAAKQFYPGKRIVAVFQPHLHSRTKKLFNDFVKAFESSDLTIISDIYFVEGRVKKEDEDVTSEQLVDAIGGETLYGGDLKKTKELILENIKKNDVAMLIGAGDIYKLGGELPLSF
ncbi:MAG: UDP-N-acetylmuramate--L-alanine ligase [bacterium]